ncbi:MAG: substrate-binding domain-containing protein [Candidatus Onthomonas sp.]
MSLKYQELADILRATIQSGVYTAAGKLPSETALAGQYSVCRQTVRRALEILADEGLIVKKHGSGSHLVQAPVHQRRVAVVLSSASDYLSPLVLDDIQNVLYSNGLTPVLFSTRNRASAERIVLEQLLSEDICGILMEGVRTALPNLNLDLHRKLRQRGIPTVFLYSAPSELPESVCISEDNEGGSYLLTRYLAGLGHTRIGGIFKSDDRQGLERYRGYAYALQDAGLSLQESRLAWFTSEDRDALLSSGDDQFLRRCLTRYLTGCTAIVCYNDEIAHPLIRILLSSGRQVPEDISVVSFDNSHYSDACPIPITSLAHRGQQLGRAAAEQLAAMLRGQPGQSQKLSWTLVKKESAGPCPAASLR